MGVGKALDVGRPLGWPGRALDVGRPLGWPGRALDVECPQLWLGRALDVGWLILGSLCLGINTIHPDLQTPTNVKVISQKKRIQTYLY